MIYATMCVGKEWVKKHKTIINNFSEKNILHILTDEIDEFINAKVYEYSRDVFSYYEKINFILSLSKKYNERVTYIDCDWLEKYNTSFNYDDDSLYSYRIFNLDEFNNVTVFFTDIEKQLRESLLNNISSGGYIKKYVPEALISFPNLKNIDDIISDVKILQPIIENIYNKESITNPRLDRYKHGIGYVEGWAISAISIKYNIQLKVCDWRKKTSLI